MKKKLKKSLFYAAISILFAIISCFSIYYISLFINGEKYVLAVPFIGILLPSIIFCIGFLRGGLRVISGVDYARPTSNIKILPSLQLPQLHPFKSHRKNFWIVPFDNNSYEMVQKHDFYMWLLQCYERQERGEGPCVQSYWEPKIGRRQLDARRHLLIVTGGLINTGPRRKGMLPYPPWRLYSQVEYVFGRSLTSIFYGFLKVKLRFSE